MRLTSFSFLVMVLSLADEGPVVVNFAGICQVCRVILEGEMGRTPSELLGAFCLLQRITDKGSWLMAPCHPAGGIPAGSRWTPDIRPVLSNIRTRDFYEEIKALPVITAKRFRYIYIERDRYRYIDIFYFYIIFHYRLFQDTEYS